MSTEIYTPTRVMMGQGATRRLSETINAPGRRCLIVTGSSSARASGVLDTVREQIHIAGCDATVYDSVRPEPTTLDVDGGIEIALRIKADLIVAVGGGSAIDTAKAISVAVFDGTSAGLVGKTLPDTARAIDVIAIPTTAGSGSEVTKGAIITDLQQGKKSGIRGRCLLPRVAIVDPAWLTTLPQAIAAQTSFDALSHAIEGFMAQRASHISRMWCRAALSLLSKTLPAIGNGDTSPSVWESQATASLLGGYIVAHASTGYPHRLQQALGGNLSVHTAHGRGLAALYPAWVDQLYRDLPPEPMNEIARLLGGSDLREVIRKLLDTLDLPQSLTALGYDAGHVELARVRVDGNLANDPLSLANQDSLDQVLNHALAT